MTKLSDLGPPVIGVRMLGLAAEDGDESIHFVECPHCGQPIDRRDLRQVEYHMTPIHEPLDLEG